MARILNEYYPNTNLPDLGNDNETAAAVQAAIWFFSDRYVLNKDPADPVYAATVAIVNKIRAEGPLVEPPPPSLTIDPKSLSGPHTTLGPYTVTTDAPGGATVNATGANMYANRAGTTPIAPGAEVGSGTKIWLRSTGTADAVLQATSQATVPSGNVYLYDGNTSGVTDAQRLILAQNATLRTTVQATAEFLPSGELVVQKTIAGPGAGSQGQVVIHVDCDDGVSRRDFIIPAGTPAGTTSHTYRHIAAGTTCTVTETSNGSVVGTDVVVTGDGQEVTIPAGGQKTVDVTDTYTPIPTPSPSSLLVTKTIAGPAAGEQGPISIQVVCNGTAFPDFTILGGTAAGSYSQSFGPVPAGSVLHGHRNHGRRHHHRHSDRVRQWPDRDHPGGRGGTGERDGRLRKRAQPGARRGHGYPESDQDHRRAGSRPARSHRHPRGLWRRRPHLRCPHTGRCRRWF